MKAGTCIGPYEVLAQIGASEKGEKEDPMRCILRTVAAIAALYCAVTASAQIPTGTLSGHVTDGKDALPGVSATVTSPSQQGPRAATTGANGDYIFAFLPPGEYQVRFELQGFETIETSIKINAAQIQRVDATMPLARVAEAVTVTGTHETFSTAGTASTTVQKDLIDKLPMGHDYNNTALLAVGVMSSPIANGAMQINGAMSFENQFLINGVPIMDNARGTPQNPVGTNPLIEDAVQETTALVANVSAEYGRFTGGVVNMLTKSGGNVFHGSYRATLNNDTWTAPSPNFTATRVDQINATHEVTLGGSIIKDHLWFFAAGRKVNNIVTAETAYTNLPYGNGPVETKYEGKLTFSITPNHRIVADYWNTDHTDQGYCLNLSGMSCMDLNQVYDSRTPETLRAFNYTGVLSDSFFVEGQYSKKTFEYSNRGSRYTDLERGTPFVDWYNFSTAPVYNSPIFCGVCGVERRDNEDYLAKASWFLSTTGTGSHNIVVGYDQFHDMRLANNYQSGSGYQAFPDGEVGFPGPFPLDPNGSPFPILTSNDGSGTSFLWASPILVLSKGNDFETQSAFANDTWRLNNHFTFNVGIRYDKNHGVNSTGALVAKDSNVSPRLGVTYDPAGDGRWQFNASYAKYVAAIASISGDNASAGGQPASLTYLYQGPDINTPATGCNQTTGAGCISDHQAIDVIFTWWSSLTSAQQAGLLTGATLYGFNSVMTQSLKSPNTDEYTIGASTRFGTRGQLRVDYVHRTWHDFYVKESLLGQFFTDPYGNQYDMHDYLNTSTALNRTYQALLVSGNFKLAEKLTIGGNYVFSQLKGNFDGEAGCCGPVPGDVLDYPEYKAYPQYNPSGYLASDQRHRLRVFGVWDILSTAHNRLSFSVMESYASGTPYSAFGQISIQPYVTNPGYANVPSWENHYFSSRGAFRWDAISHTDIAFSYAFIVPAFGADLQFFLEPRVTNIFNEHGAIGGNAIVYTSRNGMGLSPFNPFTDTPVRCTSVDAAGNCTTPGANYMLSSSFGKPQQATTATVPGDYQLPRQFVVSLGVRF